MISMKKSNEWIPLPLVISNLNDLVSHPRSYPNLDFYFYLLSYPDISVSLISNRIPSLLWKLKQFGCFSKI